MGPRESHPVLRKNFIELEKLSTQQSEIPIVSVDTAMKHGS
jgi:hypothetical protein